MKTLLGSTPFRINNRLWDERLKNQHREQSSKESELDVRSKLLDEKESSQTSKEKDIEHRE